jgi:alcohol dehydrogenase
LTLSFAIGDAIRLRRRLLRLVAGGAFDPTVVIDARGSLEDAPALYRQLVEQRCLKAVVSS